MNVVTDETDVVFTSDQVAACTTALRTALGHPPEHFTPAQLVGMMAGEIGELRAGGWSDREIAALMSESMGSVFSADSITLHLAATQQAGSA